MLGFIPKNSLGGGEEGRWGFSFRADGRERGALVAALLWGEGSGGDDRKQQTLSMLRSDPRRRWRDGRCVRGFLPCGCPM